MRLEVNTFLSQPVIVDQQCARLLLHQWDIERTLGEFPGLSAEIGLREKTDILRAIAYAMQTGVGRISSGATAGSSQYRPELGVT